MEQAPADVSVEPRKTPKLVVYSLTYCQPCKRAAAFLRENGYEFDYVEVDELPPSPRFDIKRKINPTNVRSLTFPVLSIGEDRFLYGFEPQVWREQIEGARTG